MYNHRDGILLRGVQFDEYTFDMLQTIGIADFDEYVPGPDVDSIQAKVGLLFQAKLLQPFHAALAAAIGMALRYHEDREEDRGKHGTRDRGDLLGKYVNYG